MSVPLSLAIRQARLLAVRDAMAELWFYTGTAPVTPETSTTETKLVVDTLATPAGAIGVSGTLATLTLTVPRTSAAIATGVIGWVRVVDSLGAGIMDLPVVVVGTVGTWPVTASVLQVYLGGDLQLISFVVSE